MGEPEPGRDGDDADILMWAGMHTVQAERAIQVARLLWLEEGQLAAALRVIPADAVVGRAGPADVQVADLHLQGRDERLHEVELADGAHVLAEARALEEAVDHQRGDKIADDHPRSPPRAVPKAERFIGPEACGHNPNAEPIRTQPVRPRATGER